MSYLIDQQQLLQLAEHRWPEILRALAPSLVPALEATRGAKTFHVTCPVHGGENDFRMRSRAGESWEQSGASICSCKSNPNGIETLKWANSWSHFETLREIDRYLKGQSFSAPLVRPPEPSWKRDKRIRHARAKSNTCWGESVAPDSPLAEPGRRYLAARGIDVAPLAGARGLRFHPSLEFFDAEKPKKASSDQQMASDPEKKRAAAKKSLGHFGAWIVMYTSPSGQPIALHRTYVSNDGSKAPVPEPKKLMAYPEDLTMAGCSAKLLPQSRILGIAEGFESALTAQQLFGCPVWPTYSSSILATFEVPEEVEELWIFEDLDRSEAGAEASRSLIKRHAEAKVLIRRFIPPLLPQPGQRGVDWNNVLQFLLGSETGYALASNWDWFYPYLVQRYRSPWITVGNLNILDVA